AIAASSAAQAQVAIRALTPRVGRMAVSFAAGKYTTPASAMPPASLAGPELCLGLDALPALLLADPAVLLPAPVDRALRGVVPLRHPVAERIAVPRRLRAQLRQPQLFPDLFRALHVFALRQREGRHVALHRRVDEQRRVLLVAVLALRAVALAAVRERLHVLDRVHAVRHRPQQRVGVVG